MNSYFAYKPSTPPLATEKIASERKIFFLDLKENERGRFLKITEDVSGRRNTVMLPAGAFADFSEALRRLIEFELKLSPSHPDSAAACGDCESRCYPAKL
jgi:hypothetical protein